MLSVFFADFDIFRSSQRIQWRMTLEISVCNIRFKNKMRSCHFIRAVSSLKQGA